jgi:hypothetical protein
VLLNVAIANNYAATMRRKKHCVQPLIVEKVSTYGTFAVSRDSSTNSDKFKEMYPMSKESFLELCVMPRPSSYYLHNIHVKSHTSKQHLQLFAPASRSFHRRHWPSWL